MVSDWIYKLHLHRQLNYLHARSSKHRLHTGTGCQGQHRSTAAACMPRGCSWRGPKSMVDPEHTKIKVRASRDYCRRLFVSPSLQRQHFGAHGKHWRVISGAATPPLMGSKALGLVVVQSFKLYVCPTVLGPTPHVLLNVTKFPPSPYFAILSAAISSGVSCVPQGAQRPSLGVRGSHTVPPITDGQHGQHHVLTPARGWQWGCDLWLSSWAELTLGAAGKCVLVFLHLEGETQLGGCKLNFDRINARLEMAEMATFP